ncbi:MAG: hypothetical protein ABJB76_07890 [Candidatus Nitrosocosmicus sp.]
MTKQILSVSLMAIITAIFISGPIVAGDVYAKTTKPNQHDQIGYAKGCQDGQAGKSPDPTQYDRVGGFSKHTIDYNNGYIDGYNTCSTSQQIDPMVG